MEELTFIEPDSGLEFMVNVDTENYKVIDCYTYIKDFNEIDFDDVYFGDLQNTKWTVGINKLFGHNKAAFKNIAALCVYSPETEKDWDFAHKVMAANNISQYEILEP